MNQNKALLIDAGREDLIPSLGFFELMGVDLSGLSEKALIETLDCESTG